MLETVKRLVANFADGDFGLDAKVVNVLPGLLVAGLAHRVLGLVLVVQMLPELKDGSFRCTTFHYVT